MKISGQKTALILFLGDIFFLVASLWLTLLIRYASWPTSDLFLQHLAPFSLIFAIWLVVFFISDLYRKPTALFRRQLPSLILRAQVINTLVAIVFFYYVPVFGIAPRTNLFIYLIVSFVLIVTWRTFIRYYGGTGRRLNVVFVCEGGEVEELKKEITSNSRYGLVVRDSRELKNLPHNNSLIIVFNPYQDQAASVEVELYNLLVSGATFINVHDLYEEVFDRIPVSILGEEWLLENISSKNNYLYDAGKRLLDLVVSIPVFIISLIFYPFIILAIKLNDGGPIFYRDARVGRGGRIFFIRKFRSMSTEPELSARQVTAVGKILRKTRLDELPQLLSVVKGEQSLIGPRPEKPEYVAIYREVIPYYDIRHLITPGLSGWAQIYHDNHPHFAPGAEATREKLSYDLFYLKHRGLVLDLVIGLKTIRLLLANKGI